jgi:WD40 repeat protein
MNDDPSTRTEGETLDLPEGMQAFAVGQVLGERYQILDMLGRGGMGEVWHAFDLKLRVEVALKALRPEYFRSERRLELLRQEVRAAREVMSPNVCRIFDLIEIEGRELVSMEFVDGATLLGVLHERGPLELKEAQDIASQFLAGLEAIHKVGLIHRDIKPENIMLTRAGRVVVMDFGLAREETEGGGSVAGTPAYMAPEQAAGQTLDARADVYAAGVVLAEMVSPEGIKSFESRQSIWEGVRSEPAKVPDSPWAAVIKKAVAKEREGRFNSAHTLTRALEDVTLRVEGAEDLHPYPGLASFTEEDAEYFFGREAEVEQMWRKLEGPPRMLALVGPSGAGKSSFIRAGLFAATPTSWSYVVCTPGNAATASLGRVMAREMAGDPDVTEKMMDFQDQDVAVEVLERWTQQNERALLVVDQFEELFTQNSAEEQEKFAELLHRLVLEADICVVLSMRDDFLMRCRDQDSLKPIFADMTAIPSLSGFALRRALVQPATKCGYRFEDDALVDEMLAEVEGELGALPLLAFAAARMWEQRDRDTGVLTRQAYREIGGVGGALAKHAETTIDRIGSNRIAIVRELFRNLVTVDGTRAVREWDELLSVFSDSRSESPEEVLHELIDSRLLTSFEVREEDEEPTRRVEIIHESLLANWPRLVRWQTQDQEGAQLRDELRHAARSWDEHGRHDDRLWTGTAFREYQLWRERYTGGLTETENAFSTAITSLATRRKRRRRIALAAGVALLLAVLAVVTVLWQRSVLETRRAEASKLLALGELDFDTYPTASLAWATASLELADTVEGRALALRALHRGPPVTVLTRDWEAGNVFAYLAFSPSGNWLATALGRTHVWPHDGGDPISIGPVEVFTDSFVADDLLISGEDRLRWWSIPNGQELQKGREGPGLWRSFRGDGYFIYTKSGDSVWLHWWPLDGGPGRLVGGMAPWESDDIDAGGSWIAYSRGRELLIRSLVDWNLSPRRLGKHVSQVRLVAFAPDAEHVAALDESGEIQIWPTSRRTEQPVRTLQTRGKVMSLRYDPGGSRIATHAEVDGLPIVSYWDLTAPEGAAPVTLLRSEVGYANVESLAWHPSGDWLVHGTVYNVGFWPVSRRSPVVLQHGGRVMDLIFTPDGSWLITVSMPGEGLPVGQVLAWPLEGQNDGASRVLLEGKVGGPIFYRAMLAIDPTGELITVREGRDRLHVLPVAGGPSRVLSGGRVNAFSQDGRLLASVPIRGGEDGAPVRVWNLGSWEERIVGHVHGLTAHLSFLDERSLLWTGAAVEGEGGGERVFNLEDGTVEIRSEGGSEIARLISPNGSWMLTAVQTGPDTTDYSWTDLETGESGRISTHGKAPAAGALDPSGRWMASGGFDDGIVRVGPVTGEEPHLLYGHTGQITEVAFSPNGRWIASCGYDNTVRLWSTPDMTKPPLHTLPYDQLIAKLRTFTNLRAVRDEDSATGWKVEVGPFPGWETIPDW